jgi:ATP-binding cassette subfamily F protein uup
VLDEPTNDLDIDTLDLLEELLQEYSGTLLLVSHDRAFLDNVITQSLVAEGDGRWQEYVGGYSDWLRQRPAPTPQPERPAVAAPPRKDEGERNASKVKLSYKEVRELEAIPQEIALLEAEQRDLHIRMGSDDYFRQPADMLRADAARVAEIEVLLMERLERWEALEARRRDR